MKPFSLFLQVLGLLKIAEMPISSLMTLLVLLFGIYCNVERVMLDSVVTVQENFSLEYHLCEATDQLQPWPSLPTPTASETSPTWPSKRWLNQVECPPFRVTTCLQVLWYAWWWLFLCEGHKPANWTCGMEAPGDLPNTSLCEQYLCILWNAAKDCFLFSHCTDLQLTLSCGFVLRVGGINLGLMGDSGVQLKWKECSCYNDRVQWVILLWVPLRYLCLPLKYRSVMQSHHLTSTKGACLLYWK